MTATCKPILLIITALPGGGNVCVNHWFKVSVNRQSHWIGCDRGSEYPERRIELPTDAPAEFISAMSWTLRILSGISEGICNTMVQSGGEFLYIGVGGR